jgi:hypothetical protein
MTEGPNNDYLFFAFRQYVETLLWSETDTRPEDEEGADPRPLDEDYSADDINVGALEALRVDVDDFVRAQWADLQDMDAEQAGHDFALTRNSHGAGFWDRGLGERGDRLTRACEPYGEISLYIGDDGEVYVT